MTLAFDGFVYTMTLCFESSSYKVNRIELDRWNVTDEENFPPITRGLMIVDTKLGKHTYWQLDDAESLIRGIAFLRGQDAAVWEIEDYLKRFIHKGLIRDELDSSSLVSSGPVIQ